MFHFRASAVYQLQTPLDADEDCARYRAVLPDQTAVELRVLSASCRNSPRFAPLVKRLKSAALVRHSAVRQILDMALDQDPPFVVLELPLGTSLAEEHRQRPLGFSESIALGKHLADGLVATHRLGIIHGNVTPSTIVARANRDWTLDISGLMRITSDTESAGTGRSFVAPELAIDDEPEPASDVFSLAAVIEWLLKSADGSIKDSASDLRTLLDECLRNDPAARPSAGQFAWRLSAILPSVPADNYLGPTISPEESPLAALNQTLDQAPSSSQSPVALPANHPRRLGRFELQIKLGEGGMGTVYRARDVADDAIVAIKVLNARLATSPESRRRFAKEARLLARANNPFVANLLEFNDDEGLHYLAIEFVPGGSVATLLQKRGRLGEMISLALVSDAARGLSVAHYRGIVHRDIKPDNLLLTDAGQAYVRSAQDGAAEASAFSPGEPLVKLSDFGLARVDQQSDSLAITHDGAVLGTPWYMSPEQCRGKPVDARSDVYSLGATLFHLIVGHPPFDGASHVAVINKHCHEPPPALQQLRPEVSEATASVVEKCLAKNPDARYADAGELQADIERLLSGEPTSMLLHPATPDARGGEVLEFRFRCDLAASPAQLWPYVSNTDRVNHALGLPSIRYTTRVDPQHGVERFAETKIAGQRIVWQEHPYEWIEGRRMSVLREFSIGPFAWFVNIVELSPRAGGGTRLVQTLKVAPHNWLGRWLAKWQLGHKSPRSFSQVYSRIDEYLTQGSRQNAADDAFGKSAVMSASRRSQLHQRLERLRDQQIDPTVVETLGQFLEHASDLDVARIRPLAFADRFRLDPQQVVAACLLGAREGILVLLWDILCPSCQIPADVQETLKALRDHGYCPACDLRYEVDFANSVELIFRAHPEVRAVETRTYCIGGPAFSAHVVSQTRLAPDERLSLELGLEEGIYRIRGPQLPFAVDLRVSPRGTMTRWELPLLRPPPRDSVPLLRPGSQVVTLFNDTSRELQVRLERTAGRQLAFTAAAASALALFREMFPEQVLSPGQIVSVTTITLVHAEIDAAADLYQRLGDGPAFAQIRRALTEIEDAVRRHGGAVVKIIGEGILATFADPGGAVRAAIDLLPTSLPSLRIAIHRGPALVTTLNDRLDYFGGTTHLVREMLASAAAGELLISDDLVRQPEITQLFRERGWMLDVLPTVIGSTRSIIHRGRSGAT